MPVKVKICGVTRVEDAVAACDLGADMIGLNFYEDSPRHVTPVMARDIARRVLGRATLVGVFVNTPRRTIDAYRRELGLGMLQFHGNETEGETTGFRVPVIRAVRVREPEILDELPEITGDYLLLDSFDPELFGGTGVALDLEPLQKIDMTRIIISGGLTPENVGAAVALKPWGVDVASGVESAPGVKDHAKLKSFIENAKRT